MSNMSKLTGKINLTKLEIAMIVGMVVALLGLGFTDYAIEQNRIETDLFRLHVLANSDESYDQALKLEVRDELLKQSGELFQTSKSATEAKTIASENLAEFEAVAKEVIAKKGYNYDVTCEVEKVDFDTRVYGEITVPAGEYNALQVKIGEAKGKNWWCVMFPPICLESVSSSTDVLNDAFLDGTLTKEEVEIMENPENYEIKLYSVELFEKIKSYLKKKD